ncbi:MAG: N-acetylmuramoyl-L-alanine amidase [Christensenellales bacterium]|jgi:N-acetylmuramoyl-L-alanine amidase
MGNRYRYIVFVLFAAILVITLLLGIPETVQVMGQKKGVIVIDAGHGGFDGGAIGRLTDVREDVLNLCIAKKLQRLLAADGYTVIMTREDQNAVARTKKGDMNRRKEIIVNADADIVISIHMNKFKDSSASGPIVFYSEESIDGAKLASLVQQQLNTALNPPRPRTFRPENYFILRIGDASCILVECGFLSNEREERLLQTKDYQDKCANAIYRGVELYTDQLFETDIMEDIEQ